MKLIEARGNSVILVDFQPAYDSDQFGYRDAIERCMHYLNEKNPNITAFFNGEDVGIEDTAYEVAEHFVEYGLDEDIAQSITYKEKSYAWLRGWMDQGVDNSTIIRVVRYMVMNDMNDSRDIIEQQENGVEIFQKLVGDDGGSWMYDDGIYLPEISIGDLKALSGSLLGGGGQHECLKEMQLLMNAFNIKYKMVGDWIYG